MFFFAELNCTSSLLMRIFFAIYLIIGKQCLNTIDILSLLLYLSDIYCTGQLWSLSLFTEESVRAQNVGTFFLYQFSDQALWHFWWMKYGPFCDVWSIFLLHSFLPDMFSLRILLLLFALVEYGSRQFCTIGNNMISTLIRSHKFSLEKFFR